MPKNFAAPAQKYTGKLKVEGGPVPMSRWTDRDRAVTRNSLDMHPELPPRPKGAWAPLRTKGMLTGNG